MDTINNVELRDENIFPDDKILGQILGQSYKAYLELLQLFDRHEMIYEWRYYKDGKAWFCKVQRNKKNIVWMSAWKGYMQATCYFPIRLLDKVLELDIEEDSKEKILKTRQGGSEKPGATRGGDPGIERGGRGLLPQT